MQAEVRDPACSNPYHRSCLIPRALGSNTAMLLLSDESPRRSLFTYEPFGGHLAVTEAEIVALWLPQPTLGLHTSSIPQDSLLPSEVQCHCVIV